MNQKTCLFCIGTASETIRIMPLYRVLKEQGNRVEILQAGWEDPAVRMLHQVFEMPVQTILELPPHPRQQLAAATILEQVDRGVAAIAPDMIIVEGGSATALAAALAGHAHNIPVAHLNAGRRSHLEVPATEEKTQELIARLAHWHFTATEQAMCNLLEERIPPTRVYEVGDTLIDAAHWTREHLHASTPGKAYSLPDKLRDFLFQCRSRRLILVATEHQDTGEQQIFHLAQALSGSLEQHTESLAAWLTGTGLQPLADAAMAHYCPSGHERICLTGPLPYPGMVDLLSRCNLVVTDSEYIEQNASAFGKPVLFIGNHAGHQELFKAGGALLTGTSAAAIGRHLEALLCDPAALRNMQVHSSPFGDGSAARRIADILSIVK